jgi:uncharacterized membrane protein (UPF0182 family)
MTAVVAVLFIVTAVIGRWRLSVIGTAALIIISIIVGGIYPWIVQRFQVEPSERTVESTYIDRNIQATRDAYGVSDVEEQPYDAVSDAEAGALAGDAVTTSSPTPSPSCSSTASTTASPSSSRSTATRSTAPHRTR